MTCPIYPRNSRFLSHTRNYTYGFKMRSHCDRLQFLRESRWCLYRHLVDIATLYAEFLSPARARLTQCKFVIAILANGFSGEIGQNRFLAVTLFGGPDYKTRYDHNARPDDGPAIRYVAEDQVAPNGQI